MYFDILTHFFLVSSKWTREAHLILSGKFCEFESNQLIKPVLNRNSNQQTITKGKENVVFIEKLLFYRLDAVELVGKCFQSCGFYLRCSLCLGLLA